LHTLLNQWEDRSVNGLSAKIIKVNMRMPGTGSWQDFGLIKKVEICLIYWTFRSNTL
jgi:hypothetical protein